MNNVFNRRHHIMKITISEQFKDLIFPLTNEEMVVLEQSILKHGVRDPLVVWQNGRDYLIDGHHRWSIIRKHNIKDYKVLKLNFDNKYEAINWIIDNQLGRRNATPEGLSYLRGLRYRNEKLNHGGDRKSSDHFDHLKTAEHIAEQYKISPVTIRRDEIYSNAIETIAHIFPTPKKQNDVKHKILTRHYDLAKKDIIDMSAFSPGLIKEVFNETKEFWQARSEHNKKIKKKRLERATKLAIPNDIRLYVGDALKLSHKHIKDSSIDCIISDPPYSMKALECFDKLGRIAQRVLKPSGFCCFYSGKMFLADVMRIMSQYLDYYWQIALLHHGNISKVYNPQTCYITRFNEFYKPILIFQKPPKKKQREYCDDIIQGSGAEKSLHRWQQSERELHTIVDKFSAIGDTILDIYCGSGTTGVVCKKLGRKFIGFDIDPDCIKESKIRIKNIENATVKTDKEPKISQKVNITFYQGDCRVIIPQYNLLKKSDVAIFDPPYNQNYKYDIYKDNLPKEEYIAMLRLFKNFPSCIIHYPEQSMSLVYEAMRTEPTKVISWNYNSNIGKNYRLISCFNCTPNFSKLPQPYDAAYDSRVQNIILNGSKKPMRDWWDDIGLVKNVSKEKTEHPCPIPEALCQRLLTILTIEGQTIIDPFAGSGSMAVACQKSGRNFIGVELSQNYIQIAKKRVKNCK